MAGRRFMRPPPLVIDAPIIRYARAVPPPNSGAAYAGSGGFGGVPASAAAIAGLRRIKYEYDEAAGAPRKKRARLRSGGTDRAPQQAADAACTICMEDFVAGADLLVMPAPCEHRFHEACLVRWLNLSRLCPCCRYQLPSEADEARKARD